MVERSSFRFWPITIRVVTFAHLCLLFQLPDVRDAGKISFRPECTAFWSSSRDVFIFLRMSWRHMKAVAGTRFFYYHLTTIQGSDMPRFAGFTRFSGRNERLTECANRGKTWRWRALYTHDQDFVYLPRQQSVTERISRHWRAKRGKSGQLEKNRTTVLLPLIKVRQPYVRHCWRNRSFYY